MPSKYERTLRTLRHRAREAYDVAVEAALDVIRDRGGCREDLERAIRAVAQYDEAQHALDLAEAEMPRASP